MKLLIDTFRNGRAQRKAPETAAERPMAARQTGDDTLGRGMDIALTMLVFLGLGWLLDAWLGIFPVFTITLVVFAALGTFVRLKYVYDATMERLEAERAAATRSRLEDAA